jgi:hypothetical protein
LFAALSSVALHGALLLWMLWPGTMPPAVRPYRTIDVVLLHDLAAVGRETPTPAHISPLPRAGEGPGVRAPAQASAPQQTPPRPSQPDPTVPSEAASLSLPSWTSRQPAPDRYAALQQQSFEAQRRAVLAASITTGLSNVSATLQPLLRTRIDCVRQIDASLHCTPEPEDEVRPALNQLASLASEGRRLGVLATPLHIDLGGERDVTIRLAP